MPREPKEDVGVVKHDLHQVTGTIILIHVTIAHNDVQLGHVEEVTPKDGGVGKHDDGPTRFLFDFSFEPRQLLCSQGQLLSRDFVPAVNGVAQPYHGEHSDVDGKIGGLSA